MLRRRFLKKTHVGKFVLVPDDPNLIGIAYESAPCQTQRSQKFGKIGIRSVTTFAGSKTFQRTNKRRLCAVKPLHLK